MAVGDVYQLKLNSAYLGQALLNVWWYRAITAGSGNGAAALLDGFDPTIPNRIAAITVDTMLFGQIEVVNYADPLEFATAECSVAGGELEGDANENVSWETISVRSFRTAPGQRYSYKRFSGLPKDGINGNTIESSYASIVNGAMEGIFAGPNASGWVFECVQVGKTPGTPPTSPVLGVNPHVNYVIPYGISGAFLGSQNSRKP